MKKNRIAVFTALLLSMLLLLTACGSKATIVGKWTAPQLKDNPALAMYQQMGIKFGNIEYEFTKDGQMLTLMDGKPMMEAMTELMSNSPDLSDDIKSMLGTQPNMSVTYTLEGDKISVETVYEGVEVTQSGTAKLSGDKLTLSLEGQPGVELTRVK